jgi:CheY-like chemotaxis protein
MTAKPNRAFIAAAQGVPWSVIVITSHEQPGKAERARALGAVDYLLKPLPESQQLAVIGKAVETLD